MKQAKQPKPAKAPAQPVGSHMRELLTSTELRAVHGGAPKDPRPRPSN